jgi:hypothetical protein
LGDLGVDLRKQTFGISHTGKGKIGLTSPMDVMLIRFQENNPCF